MPSALASGTNNKAESIACQQVFADPFPNLVFIKKSLMRNSEAPNDAICKKIYVKWVQSIDRFVKLLLV